MPRRWSVNWPNYKVGQNKRSHFILAKSYFNREENKRICSLKGSVILLFANSRLFVEQMRKKLQLIVVISTVIPSCTVLFWPWRHLLTSVFSCDWAGALGAGWVGHFFVNLGAVRLTIWRLSLVTLRRSFTTGFCLLFRQCHVLRRCESVRFSACKCSHLICAAN